jgi:putative hemolysin
LKPEGYSKKQKKEKKLITIIIIMNNRYTQVLARYFFAAFLLNTTQIQSMPNPASVNCGKKGGQSVIYLDQTGGQIGICYYTPSRCCEEWTMFRTADQSCPSSGIPLDPTWTPQNPTYVCQNQQQQQANSTSTSSTEIIGPVQTQTANKHEVRAIDQSMLLTSAAGLISLNL